MPAAVVSALPFATNVAGATMLQAWTPAAGNDLLIFAWWNDATTSTATISDNVDGAYTADAGGPHRHNPVIAESAQWYYRRGTTGGARTITLTVSGSVNNRGMNIFELSGVVQTGGSPYTFQYGDGSATLTVNFPTVTLGAQQILCAACVMGWNVGSPASSGGGLVFDGAAGTGFPRGALAHDVLDSGSVTGTMTGQPATTPDWLTGTAVVQGTAPAAGGGSSDFLASVYDAVYDAAYDRAFTG